MTLFAHFPFTMVDYHPIPCHTMLHDSSHCYIIQLYYIVAHIILYYVVWQCLTHGMLHSVHSIWLVLHCIWYVAWYGLYSTTSHDTIE